MSQFSQMVALALHNFLSAAAGIAVAAVIVRGIARHSSKTLGNFWVDVTRLIYYLLLPICVVYALFLVAQGVPQNFRHNNSVRVVEAQTVQVPKKDNAGNPVNDAQGKPVMVDQTVDTQTIPQGPIASQMAIKMLGTNGGGYMNANAAHPFENPTPLSKLYPDVVDLRDSQRPDVLFGTGDETPGTRLGGLGRDGSNVSRRRPDLLVGRITR